MPDSAISALVSQGSEAALAAFLGSGVAGGPFVMSDAAVTALLAAVPPTLVALGALVVGVITAIRSTRTGKKVDAVAEKATEIVAATNGNLSRLTADNKVLIERMEGLERALAASQASGVEAATVAVQSAQDVQSALAAPPPEEAVK